MAAVPQHAKLTSCVVMSEHLPLFGNLSERHPEDSLPTIGRIVETLHYSWPESGTAYAQVMLPRSTNILSLISYLSVDLSVTRSAGIVCKLQHT